MMLNDRRRRIPVRCVMIAMGAMFLITSVARSHWAIPSNAPVGRLVRNMSAYVKELPEDPQGWYILGRIHGLAFIMKSRVVGVWDRADEIAIPPNIAPDMFQRSIEYDIERNPDQAIALEERIKHLNEAVAATLRAIALDSEPAHYHLGFAHIVEEGAPVSEQASVVPRMPETKSPTDEERKQIAERIAQLGSESASERGAAKDALRAMLDKAAPQLHEHRESENEQARRAVRDLLAEQWRSVAIEYYYEAYKHAIDEDMKIRQKPLAGLRSLISYEAGEAFLRMTKERATHETTDAKRFKEVTKGIATLDAKPNNMAITPIIFSIERERSLDALLADEPITVEFDLDGDGDIETWPWVKPDTGILVWDPERTGAITSGRQLFGSVTWWMFFTDGYHALDALDDNRDGELAGDELRGLRVWFDRNTNGISEPGEVIDAREAGIAALSARALTQVGESPANPIGLRLIDGRVLPTYDWVTSPVNIASTITASSTPDVVHTP